VLLSTLFRVIPIGNYHAFVFVFYVYKNQKYCAHYPGAIPGGVAFFVILAAAVPGRGGGYFRRQPGGVMRFNAEKNKKGT
jgi:hypothetical protein